MPSCAAIEGPFDIVVVYEASRFHSQDTEDGLMCATTGVAEFNRDNQGADVIIHEVGVEAPMVADCKALTERCQLEGPPAT